MRAESRAPEIAAPALAVRDVRKRFGAIEAVNGASFDLRAGERLALLGPNGAGKTTLIRAIAGRVRPDAGSIELMGVPLVPGSVRAELGIVPQEIALYDRLTARENLMAFGRFAGIAPTDLRERVAWALDWTGLVDRAEHQVGTFSGGMKRRVNIAAGVLHRPRVILLDEPTVGVDPQSRERIYDMLDRLRDDGASILLTTHQLEEAEVRCDRIIIYDRGRVVEQGTMAELLARTIGTARRVALAVEPGADAAPDGFELDPASGRLIARVDDLVTELPRRIQSAIAAGFTVHDVDVRRPTLQAVFLQVTGRELRE